MKKLFLILMLLMSLPLLATTSTVQATLSAVHPCGGGTTCAITVTSTGSNHLLILITAAGGTADLMQQTGASGGCTSGWVHNGGDSAGLSYNNTAGGSAVDMMYCLQSASGATTINYNVATNTFHDISMFYEISCDTSCTWALDDMNNRAQGSFATNPAGVTLTITGSNDVIVQGFSGSNNPMTTIDSGYTGTFDSTDALAGFAIKLNTVSGVAPTWGNGNNLSVLNGAAFKEVAGVTNNGAATGGTSKIGGTGKVGL